MSLYEPGKLQGGHNFALVATFDGVEEFAHCIDCGWCCEALLPLDPDDEWANVPTFARRWLAHHSYCPLCEFYGHPDGTTSCPACGVNLAWTNRHPAEDVLAMAMWRNSLAASACSHHDRVLIDANASHFLARKQLEALAEAGWTLLPLASQEETP